MDQCCIMFTLIENNSWETFRNFISFRLCLIELNTFGMLKFIHTRDKAMRTWIERGFMEFSLFSTQHTKPNQTKWNTLLLFDWIYSYCKCYLYSVKSFEIGDRHNIQTLIVRIFSTNSWCFFFGPALWHYSNLCNQKLCIIFLYFWFRVNFEFLVHPLDTLLFSLRCTNALINPKSLLYCAVHT